MPAVNLETLEVVQSALERTPLARMTFTRRNRRLIPWQFYRGSVVEELSPGATGSLIIKKRGAHSAGALAMVDEWSLAGSGPDAAYIFDFNLNQAPLNQAFDNAGNPESLPDLILELNFEGADRPRTPLVVPLIVYNRYLQADEQIPEEDLPDYPLASDVLTKSGNLEGLADTAAARENLGLNNAAFRIGATGAPEWWNTELEAWVRVTYPGDPPQLTMEVLA